MAVAPRRASRRRYVLLVIVLTALTLITLDTRNGRSGPLGALGRGAHAVVGPVESAVSDVARPISDWWAGVFNSGDIKKENRNLRQQNQELQGEQRQAQAAITENENLKKLLGLHTLLDVPLVNARIVGRDPGNFDSTLTIDKGTSDGIAKDMPVIAPDKSLVGNIIEVGPHYAKIRVVTDPAFAVGVKYPSHPTSDATTGIAQGQNDQPEMLDSDIDPLAKVVKGDDVYTSPSQASLYPPDIPVGRVTRVVAQAGGLPQKVYIKPFVDLGALEYVAVLRWVQGQGAVVRTTTTTASTTTTTVANPFGATTVPTTPTTFAGP